MEGTQQKNGGTCRTQMKSRDIIKKNINRRQIRIKNKINFG